MDVFSLFKEFPQRQSLIVYFTILSSFGFHKFYKSTYTNKKKHRTIINSHNDANNLYSLINKKLNTPPLYPTHNNDINKSHSPPYISLFFYHKNQYQVNIRLYMMSKSQHFSGRKYKDIKHIKKNNNIFFKLK